MYSIYPSYKFKVGSKVRKAEKLTVFGTVKKRECVIRDGDGVRIFYTIHWHNSAPNVTQAEENTLVSYDLTGYIVKNTSSMKHINYPMFYPKVGTKGFVMQYNDFDDFTVHWENGSTSANDTWHCYVGDVELCKDEKVKFNRQENYTDEEVWAFLKPKMKQYTDSDLIRYSQEVRDMVVAAYRSGYGRASKGRPFKIGDKK